MKSTRNAIVKRITTAKIELTTITVNLLAAGCCCRSQVSTKSSATVYTVIQRIDYNGPSTHLTDIDWGRKSTEGMKKLGILQYAAAVTIVEQVLF